MRLSHLAVLAIPVLASSVHAQIARIGPAITLWTSTSAATSSGLVAERYLPLSVTAPSFNRNPVQIELREIGFDNYQGAVTLGSNVIEFTFQPSTGSVAGSSNAATLNQGQPFALSISEDGLVAVVDQNTGPKFATRASRGVPFGPAQQIVWSSGFTSTYADSKIHMEGNRYKYSWVTSAGDIAMGDFNPLAATQVTNEATVIPQSVTGTSTGTSTIGGLHSQHPITREVPAGSGNYVVLGWIFSQNPGGSDSDTYYLPSADGTQALTNQGAYRVMDTTGWQNNGTSIGSSGSLVVSDSGSGAPWHMPMIAVNNVVVPAAGGSGTMRILTEYDTQNAFQVALCFGSPIGPIPLGFTIGNTLNPSGQTVPAIGGIGLTLTPSLASFVTAANPGGFDFPLTLPALPPGTVLPVQAIAIKTWLGPPAAGHAAIEIFTGNTAVIEWQ